VEVVGEVGSAVSSHGRPERPAAVAESLVEAAQTAAVVMSLVATSLVAAART